jgi:hypothetical protein
VNRNQRLVLWIGGILAVLSLAAAAYVSAGIIIAIMAVAWWKLDTRGKPPENAVVKSVHCGSCGAIGEPHWAKCPKCGAADWK